MALEPRHVTLREGPDPQQRDDDCGINSEKSFEDTQKIEQQQDAHECREAVVADSFLAFVVHKNPGFGGCDPML